MGRSTIDTSNVEIATYIAFLIMNPRGLKIMCWFEPKNSIASVERHMEQKCVNCDKLFLLCHLFEIEKGLMCGYCMPFINIILESRLSK